VPDVSWPRCLVQPLVKHLRMKIGDVGAAAPGNINNVPCMLVEGEFHVSGLHHDGVAEIRQSNDPEKLSMAFQGQDVDIGNPVLTECPFDAHFLHQIDLQGKIASLPKFGWGCDKARFISESLEQPLATHGIFDAMKENETPTLKNVFPSVLEKHTGAYTFPNTVNRQTGANIQAAALVLFS